MKILTLSSLMTLVLAGLVFKTTATVHRVNSAPGSAAAYSSVQAAHNAASSGDTLYLECSAVSYGNLDCTKSLTIIGSGYFLGQNPQTQASPASAYIPFIQFNASSAGSSVTGLSIGQIYLYTSDILINRNYLTGNNAIYQATGSPIGNIIITQNYFHTGAYWNTSINFPYPANNILISNNYLFGGISSTGSFSAVITNNVVSGSINCHNAIIKNNIHTAGSFTNNNCSISFNLGYNNDFGNQNGNQSNVNMSNVFLGSTGNSTDGQWQLKPGSPAIGAGEGGADCGMYGGALPYVLSGMPNIPSIYYLNAPAIPSNTINVSIKAKSHN
ncbi:MAG TPA: hypothetical protein P5531_09470 [Bacteroidales bacterium]|nr:hypothetical protein [Bacteroidales bacterium]HSA43435.1 hypothetical protein [Bacteroidales bacterium]